MLILLHILGSAMCDKAHCCPMLPLLPIVVMSPLYHPYITPYITSNVTLNPITFP